MLLKLGSKGFSVETMQRFLKEIGYQLTVDGIFGKGTQKVVKQFQKQYRLKVDGIVGNATYQKILEVNTENTIIPDKVNAKFELVNTEIPHHYEGCVLRAYYCPAGILTWGWGSTGSHIYEGKVGTQEEADLLFITDCTRFVNAVNNKVKTPISQNQFDALVSFVYNIGIGAFGRSTLLKKLNRGDKVGAAKEFLKWNKGGGKVLAGLTYRRKSENLYFETNIIKFFN